MTQDLTKRQSEAANIGEEAQHDAGFQKMLKFVKGDYWCDNEEIPIGTQYIAHCIGWTKCWIHFEDRKVVDRKVYRVARREKAPERDQIPNNDPTTWEKMPDGRPRDPWAYQYLLPMENPATGEVNIFVASSFGGRRAVADLCTQYSNRAKKNPKCGQPIIKLAVTTFPTKNYGDVKRPLFEVVGWDEGSFVDKEVDMKSVEAKAQFDDEIPF